MTGELVVHVTDYDTALPVEIRGRALALAARTWTGRPAALDPSTYGVDVHRPDGGIVTAEVVVESGRRATVLVPPRDVRPVEPLWRVSMTAPMPFDVRRDRAGRLIVVRGAGDPAVVTFHPPGVVGGKARHVVAPRWPTELLVDTVNRTVLPAGDAAWFAAAIQFVESGQPAAARGLLADHMVDRRQEPALPEAIALLGLLAVRTADAGALDRALGLARESPPGPDLHAMTAAWHLSTGETNAAYDAAHSAFYLGLPSLSASVVAVLAALPAVEALMLPTDSLGQVELGALRSLVRRFVSGRVLLTVDGDGGPAAALRGMLGVSAIAVPLDNSAPRRRESAGELVVRGRDDGDVLDLQRWLSGVPELRGLSRVLVEPTLAGVMGGPTTLAIPLTGVLTDVVEALAQWVRVRRPDELRLTVAGSDNDIVVDGRTPPTDDQLLISIREEIDGS